MIEPYAGVEFPWPIGEGIEDFDSFSIGGGVQFGLKGFDFGFASMPFFIDASYMQNTGKIRTYKEESRKLDWSRFTVSISIGTKIGFFDRPKHIPKNKPNS